MQILEHYSVEDGIKVAVTQRRYRIAFQGFLTFTKQTAEQLLQEQPRQIEHKIISYIRYLNTVKQQNRGTINVSVSAIFHFFEMNDILLNKYKVRKFMPEDDNDRDRDKAYTHQQIRQILEVCDERSKVAILLMCSTGMRMGALPDIKLSHLQEYKGVYKIVVYANSPKHRYYTFCTPECKKAIDNYLEYRRRFGDPLHEKAPLIREQFDIKIAARHPRAVSNDGMLWIVTNVLRKSGQKSREIMRTHGFRKFAITQMIKAKVDYNTREFLVGHKHSRGLDEYYDRTNEDDRFQEYLKAVNLLTISEEYRLKKEVERLTVDRAQWSELAEEVKTLKELLKG